MSLSFDRERHLYTWSGTPVPSVTQILGASGLCDYSFVDEEIRNASMDRGSAVHWMLQLEDQGLLATRVHDDLKGYRKAWRECKKNLKPRILRIEEGFCSTLKFCGTPDRVVEMGTFYGVLDFKTGPILDWVGVQLAAYAVGSWTSTSGRIPMIPELTRRIAVQLCPDGRYKIKEFPMQEFARDWARFLKAKEDTRETWITQLQSRSNSESKALV